MSWKLIDSLHNYKHDNAENSIQIVHCLRSNAKHIIEYDLECFAHVEACLFTAFAKYYIV